MIEATLVVSFASRLLVGLLFLTAGVLKLRKPGAFELTVSRVGLPQPAQRAAVRALPPLEVTLGVLLVTGVLAPAPSFAAAALCVAFVAVLLRSFRQEDFDCGCFGPFLAGRTPAQAAVRNAVFVLAAAPSMVQGAGSLGLEVHLGLLVSLALVAAAAGAVILAASPRAATPPPRRVEPVDPSRRSFLIRAASLATIGAAAFVANSLGRVRPAEAACLSCGSCTSTYLWIGCTGGCCAAFWVRKNKYCSGACLSCSSWTIQEFCGYPECC